MGTGVNSQIIITSTFWKFEFFSGLLLVAMTLPMNYWLAKQCGDFRACYSGLVHFYGVQQYPLGVPLPEVRITAFYPAYVIYRAAWRDNLACLHAGLWQPVWIALVVARSITFLVVYGGGVVVLKLSEDIGPVLATIKSRVRRLFS